QLTEAIAAHRHIIADTAPAIRLAGVAEGSAEANVKKITLSSYVLLRRFEDVVKAANSRLTEMSSGRLSLVRSEEIETRGGRRTGLGLRVLDHVTGREREPRKIGRASCRERWRSREELDQKQKKEERERKRDRYKEVREQQKT